MQPAVCRVKLQHASLRQAAGILSRQVNGYTRLHLLAMMQVCILSPDGLHALNNDLCKPLHTLPLQEHPFKEPRCHTASLVLPCTDLLMRRCYIVPGA
jgi:hypothetical protein